MHSLNFPPPRGWRRAACVLLISAASLAAPAAQARNISIPFDPRNFSHPLAINNPYLPLVPGTTFVYRADTDEGCEETTVTVTSQMKRIAAGVNARPVHDVVRVGPTCTGALTLVEDTFDWYAQDDAGNVWYLGENTRECDASGCVQGQGSWEAGADVFHTGTLGVAGIIMLANPRNGDNYQQEFYADHAEDVGEVIATDADVTLERPDARQPRLLHHCLVTKERSTLEAGSTAHKYYCPNIGLVAEEDLSGGRVRAELISRER